MGKMFFSVFFQTQKHVFFSVFWPASVFFRGGRFFFRGGRFIINITITLTKL